MDIGYGVKSFSAGVTYLMGGPTPTQSQNPQFEWSYSFPTTENGPANHVEANSDPVAGGVAQGDKSKKEISSTTGFPPINNHLTGDIVRVNGKDYILCDKKWLEMPTEKRITISYQDPLDIDGGINLSISRESIVISNYMHKEGLKNGLNYAVYGGSGVSFVERILNNTLKFTPFGILVGVIGGYFDTIQSIDRNNLNHDKHVNEQRRQNE